MKTKLFTLFMLPFLFMGCSKTELSDQERNYDDQMYKKGENIILENNIDYCGDPVSFDIVGDGWKWVGTLTAGNDENYFYVTLESRLAYLFTETRLYIGTEESLPNLIDPNTHYPDPNLLPNLVQHNPGTTSFTYTIPLEDLDEFEDGCFSVIAYVAADDGTGPINSWAGDLTVGGAKPRPYYFNICIEPCQPSTSCETAYAWGDEYAHCFSEYGFNNWGWTNGLLPPGTYDFEIWAAAGQCDLSKGMLVGMLNINYDGSSATVTYSMDAGFTLNETHLYIGSEPLPQKNNGQYTVAPGQYPYKDDDLNGATSHTYVADGLSGDIYVIGHAVVCGDFPIKTTSDL